MPRYIVQPGHRLHLGAGAFLGPGEAYECSVADARRMGPALQLADAAVEQALADRKAKAQQQVRLAGILAAVAAGELDPEQAVKAALEQAPAGRRGRPLPAAPAPGGAPAEVAPVAPGAELEPAPLGGQGASVAPLVAPVVAPVAAPANKPPKGAAKAGKAEAQDA